MLSIRILHFSSFVKGGQTEFQPVRNRVIPVLCNRKVLPRLDKLYVACPGFSIIDGLKGNTMLEVRGGRLEVGCGSARRALKSEIAALRYRSARNDNSVMSLRGATRRSNLVDRHAQLRFTCDDILMFRRRAAQRPVFTGSLDTLSTFAKTEQHHRIISSRSILSTSSAIMVASSSSDTLSLQASRSA